MPGSSPTGSPGSAWGEQVRGDLLGRRVVLLRGELDDQLAGQIAAELMMLDATGDDPVTLHVDSRGGPLHAAFGLIDTIDLLGVPVETVCVGRAEGSAVAVVAAGTRRYASTHAQFRLSEPDSTVSGSARDIEAWAAERQRQLAAYVSRLAAATKRPAEHVEADLSLGRWLDAPGAIAYGLVDALWSGPSAGPRLGFR